MKKPSRAHIAHVLAYEREIAPQVFTPPTAQERADMEHALDAMDRAREERQRELPLPSAA